jgi:hypothetical protein
LSSTKELVIKAKCATNSFNAYVDVDVDKAEKFAVYRYGYRWSGTAWEKFDYVPSNGSKGASNQTYYQQSVISKQDLSYAGDTTYILAYTCFYSGGTWKCGCSNSSCTQSMWNIQAANKKQSAQEKPDNSLTLTVSPSQVEYVSAGFTNAYPSKPVGPSQVTLTVKNNSSTKTFASYFDPTTYLQYYDECRGLWRTFDYPDTKGDLASPSSARTWKPGTSQSYNKVIIQPSIGDGVKFFASLRYPVKLRFLTDAYQGGDALTSQEFASDSFKLYPPGCLVSGNTLPADYCAPVYPACSQTN